MGLREGAIILLDGGRCEFTEFDPSAPQTLYQGVYAVGVDLNVGKINVKCSSEYMEVTLFESEDDYIGYHQTSRFTVGEESDALAMYAESDTFLNTGESTNANLLEGAVLLVKGGAGACTAAEGPVIN